jgi:hypothetical protein
MLWLAVGNRPDDIKSGPLLLFAVDPSACRSRLQNLYLTSLFLTALALLRVFP